MVSGILSHMKSLAVPYNYSEVEELYVNILYIMFYSPVNKCYKLK
jgi:hypothetical protein